MTVEANKNLPVQLPNLRVFFDAARPIVVPVLFVAFLGLLWEYAVRWAKVPEVILPPPSSVGAVVERTFKFLLQQGQQTLTECVMAFAMGASGGVALAVLVTSSRLLKEALYPTLVLFQFVPKIALAPLFLVWFGIGPEARLAFAFFICLFPVFVATSSGLLNTPPDLVRLMQSLRATRWQILTQIRFPCALPMIFSGLRIGVTMSIIGIVVGEFIVSQKGLGYMVLFSSSRADTPLMLAAISLLCAIGLGLFGIVVAVERIVLSIYARR